MKDFCGYQRTILFVILALGGAVATGLAVLWPQDMSICLGWLLGCAAGVVVFRLRVASVLGMARGNPRTWGRASIRASMTQFGVVLAALLVAALSDRVNLYACIGGIFLERLVLIADGLLRPAALSGPAENETPAHGDKP